MNEVWHGGSDSLMTGFEVNPLVGRAVVASAGMNKNSGDRLFGDASPKVVNGTIYFKRRPRERGVVGHVGTRGFESLVHETREHKGQGGGWGKCHSAPTMTGLLMQNLLGEGKPRQLRVQTDLKG